MGRLNKQSHGKVYTGGKGDTNAGMTKQAAGSERNIKHRVEMTEAAQSRRAAKKRAKKDV